MRDQTRFFLTEYRELPVYSSAERSSLTVFSNAIRSHKNKQRILVVFDLDNTLIDSNNTTVQSPLQSFEVAVEGQRWRTYIRPHVYDFFSTLTRHGIKYAVWTAGVKEYARKVVKGIQSRGKFSPVFVWSRSETSLVHGNYVKDMRKAARYGKVVLLDDSMHHTMYFNNETRVQTVPLFVASRYRDDFFHHLTKLTSRLLE